MEKKQENIMRFAKWMSWILLVCILLFVGIWIWRTITFISWRTRWADAEYVTDGMRLTLRSLTRTQIMSALHIWIMFHIYAVLKNMRVCFIPFSEEIVRAIKYLSYVTLIVGIIHMSVNRVFIAVLIYLLSFVFDYGRTLHKEYTDRTEVCYENSTV